MKHFLESYWRTLLGVDIYSTGIDTSKLLALI